MVLIFGLGVFWFFSLPLLGIIGVWFGTGYNGFTPHPPVPHTTPSKGFTMRKTTTTKRTKLGNVGTVVGTTTTPVPPTVPPVPTTPVVHTTVQKDSYGTRVGTEAHKINICVQGYTGLFTVVMVCTGTGYSIGRVRNHLQWLKTKGFIVRVPGGYQHTPVQG